MRLDFQVEAFRHHIRGARSQSLGKRSLPGAGSADEKNDAMQRHVGRLDFRVCAQGKAKNGLGKQSVFYRLVNDNCVPEGAEFWIGQVAALENAMSIDTP